MDRTIDVKEMFAPVEQALGTALSSFSNLESMLGFVFSKLFTRGNEVAAQVAFDAIGLTAPKIRVLKSVAARVLPQDLHDELKNILKRVDARTELRTKLAHWTINLWSPTLPITTADALR